MIILKQIVWETKNGFKIWLGQAVYEIYDQKLAKYVLINNSTALESHKQIEVLSNISEIRYVQ